MSTDLAAPHDGSLSHNLTLTIEMVAENHELDQRPRQIQVICAAPKL